MSDAPRAGFVQVTSETLAEMRADALADIEAQLRAWDSADPWLTDHDIAEAVCRFAAIWDAACARALRAANAEALQ